jgi:hypothetical protein
MVCVCMFACLASCFFLFFFSFSSFGCGVSRVFMIQYMCILWFISIVDKQITRRGKGGKENIYIYQSGYGTATVKVTAQEMEIETETETETH